MRNFIKDFLWGTFNYRNKGMPIKDYLRTGYNFAKLQREDRKKRGYEGGKK